MHSQLWRWKWERLVLVRTHTHTPTHTISLLFLIWPEDDSIGLTINISLCFNLKYSELLIFFLSALSLLVVLSGWIFSIVTHKWHPLELWGLCLCHGFLKCKFHSTSDGLERISFTLPLFCACVRILCAVRDFVRIFDEPKATPF